MDLERRFIGRNEDAIDNASTGRPTQDHQVTAHMNYEQAEDAEIPPIPIPRALTYRLYTSHFLSTWNSRLFEFGATLFLASIFPGTLLPMSIYAFARSGSAILFSPAVGDWIDKGNRLKVVRVSIIGQRLAVAASCGIFLVLEDEQLKLKLGKRAMEALFALSIVLACVEKLCSVMNLVSIERDWVVVITEDNNPARQGLNARLRRIDLLCKLLGPLVISLISGASIVVAIWVTFAMSIVSVALEYAFIAKVYRLVPRLHERSVSDEMTESTPLVGTPDISLLTKLNNMTLAALNAFLPIRSLPFYLTHSVFLPSFALSLLYLTVLSFSGQMITYLLFTGYTSLHVGITRTISTAVELTATWIAPRIAKKIGTVRSGIWFLSWQMAWLAAGISFFFAEGGGNGEGKVKAVSGLVGGVILSRMGLWGFDLSVQAIVQDAVVPSNRGAFSTVEAAFQNLFELLSYAMTIIWSRSDQFRWPIIVSVGATYIAGALFAAYVRLQRGHLLHAPPCVPCKYLL